MGRLKRWISMGLRRWILNTAFWKIRNKNSTSLKGRSEERPPRPPLWIHGTEEVDFSSIGLFGNGAEAMGSLLIALRFVKLSTGRSATWRSSSRMWPGGGRRRRRRAAGVGPSSACPAKVSHTYSVDSRETRALVSRPLTALSIAPEFMNTHICSFQTGLPFHRAVNPGQVKVDQWRDTLKALLADHFPPPLDDSQATPFQVGPKT